MKIHLLSDTHFEHDPASTPPVPAGVDVIVAAGDLAEGTAAIPWLASLGRPVIYVAGNHELWGADDYAVRLDELRAAAARTANVRFLEHAHVDLGGVRFLGCTLWTDYGGGRPGLVDAAGHLRDYVEIGASGWYDDPARRRRLVSRLWRLGRSRFVIGHVLRWRRFHPVVAHDLHRQARAWLDRALRRAADDGVPAVVVTHHAPSYDALRHSGQPAWTLELDRWRERAAAHDDAGVHRVAAYASDLGTLLARHRRTIACWCHGHVHHALDYVDAGVRIRCNPRGHPGAYARRAPGEPPVRWHGDGTGYDAALVIDLAADRAPGVDVEPAVHDSAGFQCRPTTGPDGAPGR